MSKLNSIESLKAHQKKLEKDLAKLEKKTRKASDVMNKSASSENYAQYNTINSQRAKTETELNLVYGKIRQFNIIEKKVRDITLSYSKDFEYQKEFDANNDFNKLPFLIDEEIEAKTPLKRVDTILIEDYPYHESGLKLDMKEREHVFTDPQKQFLCKVRTKVYGSDIPYFKESPFGKKFGNKVKSFAVCGVSDEEVTQKLKDKLYENDINRSRAEDRSRFQEKYL